MLALRIYNDMGYKTANALRQITNTCMSSPDIHLIPVRSRGLIAQGSKHYSHGTTEQCFVGGQLNFFT